MFEYMDVVITYVDGNDPMWQEDYRKAAGAETITKRYRDMGTLRYLFRGLEKYMPEVENVFLLVSRDSQVPSWINRGRVTVVTHADIIPADKLPLFNSCAIELFLHRIPRLGERFLYFNDDMFPVAPLSEEDFFPGGKIRMGFGKHILPLIEFKKQCLRSDRLARKAAGKRPCLVFVRPQHNCTPMLRSASAEAFAKVEKELLATVTPLRSGTNVNQYFFPDYCLFTGRAVDSRLPSKYFSLGFSEPEKAAALIDNPGKMKLVCINDARVPEEKYERSREMILGAFGRRFPEKSCFEL